jgi:hypothetical protein
MDYEKELAMDSERVIELFHMLRRHEYAAHNAMRLARRAAAAEASGVVVRRGMVQHVRSTRQYLFAEHPKLGRVEACDLTIPNLQPMPVVEAILLNNALAKVDWDLFRSIRAPLNVTLPEAR